MPSKQDKIPLYPAFRLLASERQGLLSVRRNWLLRRMTRRNIEEIPAISLYLLPGNTPRPMVIIAAGGAYVSRSEEPEGLAPAAFFNQLGCHAAVLHYRLCPFVWPDPLDDARRALRMLRFHAEDWRIDRHKIGMLGFSAGGHLTASLAVSAGSPVLPGGDEIDQQSDDLQFQIIAYAPTRMSDDTWIMKQARIAILGKQASAAQTAATDALPGVSSRTPPAFIWHTAADSFVPAGYSRAYASLLEAHGVPCELHIYPKGRHGLGMCQQVNDQKLEASQWPNDCARWLRSRQLI